MNEAPQGHRRVAIFNDTSLGGHYGCYAVMNVLVSQLRQQNIDPVVFWPCSQDWRQYKQKIESLGVDGLIVNGEGSIHSTRTRARAQFLTELGPFCRDHLKIPSAIVNASFYNLDEQAFRNLAAFGIISTRESRSQSYLSEHGITSLLVPDFSFFSPLHADVKQDRSGVFVTDSVFKSTRKALEKLTSDFGFHYEVMKQVPKTNSHLGLQFKKIGRELKKFLNKMNPRPPFYHKPFINEDFEGFLERLRSSKNVLTGRFHTATLAIATKTPVMAIESNTPKISAVFYDVFGSTDRARPLDETSLPEYFHEAAQGFPYSEHELAAIDRYLTKGKFELNQLFDNLAQTLNDPLNHDT